MTLTLRGPHWPGPAGTARRGRYRTAMPAKWEKTTAQQVAVGDRVRIRHVEITASRIEHGFLGRPGMMAFIEDTSERWLKVPTKPDGEVEVLREA